MFSICQAHTKCSKYIISCIFKIWVICMIIIHPILCSGNLHKRKGPLRGRGGSTRIWAEDWQPSIWP
jgi:hypothetical protein